MEKLLQMVGSEVLINNQLRPLVGHSDLATTQRYADVDADDLRGAIALLDGNSVETAKSRGR